MVRHCGQVSLIVVPLRVLSVDDMEQLQPGKGVTLGLDMRWCDCWVGYAIGRWRVAVG